MTLKSELQKKSETIVSLNEQIGKLAKADIVLKENERLKQSEKEARERAKAVEDGCISKMTDIDQKDEALEREKRWLKYKSEEVENTVASKLMVAESALKSRVERKYKTVIIAVFVYVFIVTLINKSDEGWIDSGRCYSFWERYGIKFCDGVVCSKFFGVMDGKSEQ